MIMCRSGGQKYDISHIKINFVVFHIYYCTWTIYLNHLSNRRISQKSWLSFQWVSLFNKWLKIRQRQQHFFFFTWKPLWVFQVTVHNSSLCLKTELLSLQEGNKKRRMYHIFYRSIHSLSFRRRKNLTKLFVQADGDIGTILKCFILLCIIIKMCYTISWRVYRTLGEGIQSQVSV